ncbi:UDP-N-acetylmuramate--L-alanine ligase [Paenarthrobacter sp. Z7-10]|uniref:UDP-N-acetylmuramate--L-alanine ligase n=1 Tax=Paenarthrobacter sp. Z7-10 TaxID=2787635 RepID=UPI003FA714C3
MSAVARILLARGVAVSGSDAKDSSALQELAALGATVHVGHSAAAAGGADTVVVSSAIRADNPELVAARAAGGRVLHRSEALAAAMAGQRVVAVAGTHGKTTTTSMITVLLRGAGMDPSFAIGGTVPALGVNAAHGGSGIFVAEADESDGSFLNYSPQIAVVTNVEPDHLDHYGTAEAFYRSFDDFAALLPAGGLLVACADDDGALALARRAADAGTRVVLYGRNERADLVLSAAMDSAGIGTRSTVTLRTPVSAPADGAVPAEADAGQLTAYPLQLQVPGVHNALNAVAALAVALELGVQPDTAVAALQEFSGAARRFEQRGEIAGVRVFDDYAHHPTEVEAALRAARTVAGGHRVHVLFQPHLFSRTREFAPEFARALRLANSVAVLDIYPAREDPIPGVSSELITAVPASPVAPAAQAPSTRAPSTRAPSAMAPSTQAASMPPGELTYQPDARAAVAALAGAAEPGDIILTIGAGDVTQYGPWILDALSSLTSARTDHGT